MRLAAFAFVLLSPAIALAQPAAPAPGDDCARARAAQRQCVLTVEPEEISGGVVRPDGQAGAVRIFAQLGSLFRPRREFLREIVAAAHEVP